MRRIKCGDLAQVIDWKIVQKSLIVKGNSMYSLILPLIAEDEGLEPPRA